MTTDRAARTIFDIGMFDGADTAYYLQEADRVVAVEANPDLVAAARERFADPIAAGRLAVIHAALAPTPGPVRLMLSGSDLASSSTIEAEMVSQTPAGVLEVPGITLDELFGRFGAPYYIKVDIEGADRVCVLALSPGARPPFLSFEVGDDADELIAHAARIGYTRFKIISQTSFRELANQDCLEDRIRRRLMHWLGFRAPQYIRRAGRFFRTGSCSGPGALAG